MDRPDREVNRVAEGAEAKRLLNGPVMEKAFQMAESNFIESWKDSKEPEMRDLYWAQVQALQEVRRMLRRIISDGEYASRHPDAR